MDTENTLTKMDSNTKDSGRTTYQMEEEKLSIQMRAGTMASF